MALIPCLCCGDGQPSGEDWYVVLTFGDDQKGFKLQFATDEGKEICAKVSATADGKSASSTELPGAAAEE